MFKIELHTTEKNSAKALDLYFSENHPQIKKEFLSHIVERNGKKFKTYLWWSEKKDNPDILVQKKDKIQYDNEYEQYWTNHCAIENKFDDYTPSLNSGHLLKQLTEMKKKYTFQQALDLKRNPIPLYLVVVNRWEQYWTMAENRDGDMVEVKREAPLISHVNLVRGFKMCQRLNIRFEYCSHKGLYAAKIIKIIRKPPKQIVDLGQKFIVKSSGSIFNQQLQIQPGITIRIADNIENYWQSWYQFSNYIRIWLKNGSKKRAEFFLTLRNCFTSESGRVMESNLDKFLQEVHKIA